MRGAIFVGSKCPDNFGPVFSSRLPVLDTPIRRLFFPFSFCTRSYTKRLIDFLTGLLYEEDVYIVIAINPVNSFLFFNRAAHSRPMI